MSFDFNFPDVGEGIAEGELISWKVKEGDAVKADQVIAEIETDKAVVEIPAPKDAKVLKLHYKAGDTVKVGAPLITFGDATEEVAQPAEKPKIQESNPEYKKGICVNGICVGGPCVCPTPNAESNKGRPDAGAVVGQLPEYEEEAPQEHHFVLKSGENIKSLVELSNKLRQIDNETFTHHVNEYRNDFAHWVRDIFHNAELAGRISKAQTKEEMLDILANKHQDVEVKAMPAVKKLAKEHNVDLTTIVPTGKSGNITKADVLKASESSPSIPKKPSLGGGIKITKRDFDLFGYIEKVPLRCLRKTIARNMERSSQRTAAVTAFDEVDVTSLWALRKKEKDTYAKEGIKLTFLPYILKACIEGLKKHPYLNGTVDDDTQEIILKKYYNFGIAVDTEQGLVVPVLKIADKKDLGTIAKEITELAGKAKGRKLDIAEMRGGTFTISNIGAIGGQFATPIINYPEIAILLTGRIYEKPLVKGGAIEVRKVLPLSLTYDHRIVDGADAARFMNEVKKVLENAKF